MTYHKRGQGSKLAALLHVFTFLCLCRAMSSRTGGLLLLPILINPSLRGISSVPSCLLCPTLGDPPSAPVLSGPAGISAALDSACWRLWWADSCTPVRKMLKTFFGHNQLQPGASVKPVAPGEQWVLKREDPSPVQGGNLR